MQLYMNQRSPFARKVRVVAFETGTDGDLECVELDTAADRPSRRLLTCNPLAKIPTLILADGVSLHDSAVICEYLNSVSTTRSVLPIKYDDRIACLKRQSMADGILDLLVGWRTQTLTGVLSKELLRGNVTKLAYWLRAVEAENRPAEAPLDLGDIAVGCAFGYLDFRYKSIDWRRHAPLSALWFDSVAISSSFKRTPHGTT